MVSRRKILSRSRDDLHLDGPVPNSEQEEEDIWYNKEKLYKVGINSLISVDIGNATASVFTSCGKQTE